MEYHKELNYLYLRYYFEKDLKNIPQDIEIIKFENDSFPECSIFNMKVDNLPQSLKEITFAHYFNQKINHLPKNLTHLTFGVYFNRKVEKLPKNLKYLYVNWYFQNEIILPKNLKELTLSCNNNLLNNIPKHIEKINIYFSWNIENNKRVENLPLTIKEIVIKNEYKKYVKVPFGSILTIKN
jgi:hypothetical protein